MKPAKNPRVLVLALGCLAASGLSAQEIPDSSILLPQATVLAEPLRQSATGQHREQLPAEQLRAFSHQNLADLLAQQAGVYIKSYGNGSLATSSIRGGSAGHTSVLWNGLPLSSPMLGLLDLALLPVSFADELSIQFGSSSAAWGSGAIGGVIALDNRAPRPEERGLSLQQSLGSFGFSDTQGNARYGGKRWSGRSRAFLRQAENNFPYRIRPDLPERTREHAAMNQHGWMQELYWSPNPQHEFALHLWRQQAQLQIPPTTTQTISEAEQADAFLRTALHWKRKGTWSWQGRAAWFDERNRYIDPRQGLDTDNHFRSLLAELETLRRLSSGQQIQLSAHGVQVQAATEAYQTPRTQHRLALFGAFRQPLRRGIAQLKLRSEWVDGQRLPLTPELGLDWALSARFDLQVHLARSFRLPTLNDLYWQPGGNPELLPEQGWSQELGLRYRHQAGHWKLLYRATGFNRLIHQWIFWSIAEGELFWSPQNIGRVWSRGLEQQLRLERQLGSVQTALQLQYDYIRSTSAQALRFPQLEAGQQLFYTPVHQATAGVQIRYQQWQFHYRHQFTGAVTALNQEAMERFHLGFLQMSWSWKQPRWGGQLFLSGQNLWNAQYRVIERHPMPGRQWQLGVQLEWLPRTNA